MSAIEVAAGLAVLAGALLQAAVGFGFSLVAAPLMFAAAGPQQAVGLLTALAFEVNLISLFGEGRRPVPLGRTVVIVLIASVPGMVAGVAVLRGVDAADARDRLAATWRTESAAGRATLLASLETALGPDDEPFLEQALDDRGREVRAVAAALLASIPGSALVARMTERAQAALRYEAGGLLRRARLVVTLPDAPDTAAVRDGVQPTPPPGAGERTWWLAQILAAVPPRTWTDAWGVSAPRLIELARESEWAEPLADGWARATLRARDVAWADALLRANVLVDRHARLAPPRAQLLALLGVAQREALLADAIGGRALIDPGELLAGATHAWSAPFARDVLGWLRRRAQAAAERPDARPADDWRVVELLAAFALRVPPALAGAAVAGWPDVLPPAWARAVERLVAVLTFRRALDAAFTSPRP